MPKKVTILDVNCPFIGEFQAVTYLCMCSVALTTKINIVLFFLQVRFDMTLNIVHEYIPEHCFAKQKKFTKVRTTAIYHVLYLKVLSNLRWTKNTFTSRQIIRSRIDHVGQLKKSHRSLDVYGANV